MGKFYIKELRLYGETETDVSSVSFTKGLNAIIGPSNTGKTILLLTLEYALGKEKIPDFFKDHNVYNKVELDISTEQGIITIKRNIGETKVEIISDIATIKNGIYTLNGKMSLKKVIFDIMGIDNDSEIPVNKQRKLKSITWRPIVKRVFIAEKKINTSSSVLTIEREFENITYAKSVLLFLLYDKFYEEVKSGDDNVEKAVNKALLGYVSNNISDIVLEKARIDELCQGIDVDNLKEKIDNLVDNIAFINEDLKYKSKQLVDTVGQISDISDDIVKNTILISKYKDLLTQYESDLKRLDLIVAGCKTNKNSTTKSKCPICNHEVDFVENSDYLNYALIEKDTIEKYKADLTKHILEKEIILKQLNEELEYCNNHREDIITETNGLKLEAANLDEQYSDLTNKLELINTSKVLNEYYQKFILDMDKYNKINKVEEEYYPENYFKADFKDCIESEIKKILGETSTKKYNSIEYDLKELDLIINGFSKASSQGKGYCAYFNSINLIAWRNVLNRIGKHKFPFLVIDSPVTGFDTTTMDEGVKSTKEQFFDYLINNQDDGQLIIVENMDLLSDYTIESLRRKCNYIEYSLGEKANRKGFINNFNEFDKRK